ATTTGAGPPSPRPPRPPRPPPRPPAPPAAFPPAADVSLPPATANAATRHTQQKRQTRFNTDVGSKESVVQQDTGRSSRLFTPKTSFNVSANGHYPRVERRGHARRCRN